MANQTRRDFLKTTAIISAGITGLSTTTIKASPLNILSEDRMGVLIDTTVCVGCRKCEWACKNSHDMLNEPIENYEDRSVFKNFRRPDHTSLTIVNEYSNPKNSEIPIDLKVQCMHCDRPACVSACIVGAFSKYENGSVIWDENKCIGCRYCMVACPFQIPTFEFHKAIGARIMKCDFCFGRTKEGLLPACVEMCPVEALTYGKRNELIEVARKRIKRDPQRYVDHILGENEVGGTSWMYLAGIDFSKLDFPKLGKDPAPGVSESIQHGIFAYFVPPISLYALLGGIMWLNKKQKEKSEEH
ncbi:MAG: 4Fe-4S ferredoxin [Ignavibacteria bacterium RBG_13_36_8]|nr:MAG: 4Fe-4S ferredoxin [Ignavibacteria bacterium RBG_13_36_8]